MVKAILFDFWGTLVETGEWSPLKQVRNILGIKMSFSEFVNRLEKTMMTKKFDSLTDAFTTVCQEFKIKPDNYKIERLIGMWNKSWMLAKPYPETEPTLLELQKDYQLVLISNTDNFSVPNVLEKFKLNKYFNQVFYSFELELIKTDKKFLEKTMEKLNLQPQDCLLVGDSLESDMAAAQAAGIKAVMLDRKETRIYGNKSKNLQELKALL